VDVLWRFDLAYARHRELDSRGIFSGSKFYYLANPQTSIRIVAEGETKFCDDVIGNPHGANPLQIDSITVTRPRLTGEQWSGSQLVRKLTNWPIDYEPTPVDPRTVFPELDVLERSNYAWETLGKTNISVPIVSVPTFIGELKDIPSLVRDWGGNILRQVAKGHLSWRWAVRPLLSDLGKLYDLSDSLRRLELDLSLLSQQKYLRKRTTLSPGYPLFPATPVDVTIDSGSTGSLITATRTPHRLHRLWGSVKWTASPDFRIPLGPSGRDFRLRTSLGINSQAALATLWELTPWSWFIDWFAGIGTIISATNNAIPMTWGNICIMRTTTVKSMFQIHDGLWSQYFSLSGELSETHTRKERWPSVPVLPFVPSYLPLFDSGKWSILASLLALKWFRAGRPGKLPRRVH